MCLMFLDQCLDPGSKTLVFWRSDSNSPWKTVYFPSWKGLEAKTLSQTCEKNNYLLRAISPPWRESDIHIWHLYLTFISNIYIWHLSLTFISLTFISDIHIWHLYLTCISNIYIWHLSLTFISDIYMWHLYLTFISDK